eukprot:CAMPEP_0183333078 /NCGR_PEP_ID=MMETSP0164_2-20130417/2064_1 /TAXON_ID=221442 /ORGANISM="Coccolithus pelagicus ssp braarudi, Strain PLY182g" /LENGTH=202 /DNA_ID=CAMNT_0025501907 /DNA_START=11 /DNA_END=619 /DNA_ORIENTATION=+
MARIAGRLLLHAAPMCALQLAPLDAPIPLDSPVFSLSTIGTYGGHANMNILTFATPVALRQSMWTISLWRRTATHSAFTERRTGVLQLLAEEHSPLTAVLGGKSRADMHDEWKPARCAELGFEWSSAAASGPESLLPGCIAYYRLVQVGELIDAGEHDIAVCRVEGAWGNMAPSSQSCALSTGALREAGLISSAGRVVLPDA